MDWLTEIIIRALVLGLVGLIATFFLVINKRFKRWLEKLFGLNIGNPQKPIQSIVLIGHSNDGGWRYSLNGKLHRRQVEFEGQFEVTLQGFPPDYPHSRWAKERIDRAGIEFVRGAMKGERLALSGYKMLDAHKLGLLPSEYTIQIDEIKGNFREQVSLKRARKWAI